MTAMTKNVTIWCNWNENKWESNQPSHEVKPTKTIILNSITSGIRKRMVRNRANK